jgi:hypothetical protein
LSRVKFPFLGIMRLLALQPHTIAFLLRTSRHGNRRRIDGSGVRIRRHPASVCVTGEVLPAMSFPLATLGSNRLRRFISAALAGLLADASRHPEAPDDLAPGILPAAFQPIVR